MTKFFTGKVTNFSRKWAKKLKNLYILLEKLEIFLARGLRLGRQPRGPPRLSMPLTSVLCLCLPQLVTVNLLTQILNCW